MLRTLKDHLNQCPSKLSEEMVRCMAAVYCWLRSTASANAEQNRSPLLSRSSTNVVLPRKSVGEEREWSSRSTVEISSISTDNNNFSHASCAINNYRCFSICCWLSIITPLCTRGYIYIYHSCRRYSLIWIFFNKFDTTWMYYITWVEFSMWSFSNCRLLVEQLERVSIDQMEDDAQLAFWINVHNSLVMHVSNCKTCKSNAV